MSELSHYGVPGMKWGIRKKEDREPKTDSVKKMSLSNPKFRKAAYVAASVTALVAGAYVAHLATTKHSAMSKKTVDLGRKFSEKILSEPKDIIYTSKPYRGSGAKTHMGFVNRGQTEDFFQIFENSGLFTASDGHFAKLPNGSVSAVFSDLLGRVDDAFRPIPHSVLIPPDQAVGLNSLEDVIEKFGPRLEEEFQAYIKSKLQN